MSERRAGPYRMALEPASDVAKSGWRLRVAGDVSLEIEMKRAVTLEEMGVASPVQTAYRGVHLVSAACAVPPGTRKALDLPQIITKLTQTR